MKSYERPMNQGLSFREITIIPYGTVKMYMQVDN